MKKLQEFHPYCYGSIARGDITLTSDSDIIIDPTPSYKYELKLDIASIPRSLVQATPNSSPKVVYQITDKITLSVPFSRLSQREIEFINFGGKLDIHRFENNEFSPGINKQLMLVQVNDPKGYTFKYSSVLSQPIHLVARKVNCGVDIIMERIRVLKRRDEIGRTGLYINRELAPDEQPEEVIKKMSQTKPGLRKVMARRRI